MRLADIRIYPVKSLRGASCADACVEPWGLAGDRRWMVVDPAGKFLTQRTHPSMALIEAAIVPGGLRLVGPGALPVAIPDPKPDAPVIEVTVWRDQVPARLAAPEASAMLESVLGAPCQLVWLHDTGARAADPAYAPPGSTVSFADGFPLLLTCDGSLRDLNRRLAAPIAMGRFRPNLTVEGAAPWEEDRWQRIRIGGTEFAVVKPCSRCIVTTIDPDTGERPDRSEPLRSLGRFRKDVSGGVMFGQNLVPLTPGRVKIGDTVEILRAGAPNVRL